MPLNPLDTENRKWEHRHIPRFKQLVGYVLHLKMTILLILTTTNKKDNNVLSRNLGFKTVDSVFTTFTVIENILSLIIYIWIVFD